jgi:hypothetical protein
MNASTSITISSAARQRPGRALLFAFVLAALGALLAVSGALAAGGDSAAAPANSSLPTISGVGAPGTPLTANTGTWTGATPLSYQFQWLICGERGEACHAISGATAQNYQLKADDAGNTARVEVIVSNAHGSAKATSDPQRIAAASGATPTSLPTIAGDSKVGSTLAANVGSWSGLNPITFKYQWLLCDATGAGCRPLSGATANSYIAQSADLGSTLRVEVTATNAGGSASSTSQQTSVVATATGCPGVPSDQAVDISSVTLPAHLQVATFTPLDSITGRLQTLRVTFRITDTCGHPVRGAELYATAVPYGQVSIPPIEKTDDGGYATLFFHREQGFPANSKQQLLVLFVRATKPGDSLLAGISARRLISLPVSLNG